jgi:hypothetical protein
MNSRFGQIGQSFYRVFVSNSGAVLTSGTTDTLAQEQFGIFKKDGTTGTQPVAVAGFSNTVDRVIIATGTPSSPAQTTPYTSQRQNFNYTSTADISAKDIVGWRGVKAKQGSSTQLVTLGYNGIDASSKMSLNAKLDHSPLVVKMILRGEPIRRYFRDYEITRTYQIDKGLCTASCDCFDPCGKVPAGLVADKLIEAVKRDKWMGIAIDKFVKTNKLESCATDTCAAPSLTEYTNYTIDVCDDGATTLGKLQAAYPGKKITRKKRTTPISTYEMDFIPTATPADFTLTGGFVIPSCSTCPSGYTLTAAARVIEVKYLKGATPATVSGSISRVLTATTDVHDIYLYVLPTSKTDGDIATAFAGIEYIDLGTKSEVCSSNSSTTYSWTAGTVCNRTTKDYKITLGDTTCGTSRLADLQAAYPDNNARVETRTSVVTKSSVITLTGTSGTATIAIGATSATATFATSLTVTRNNFITANAATFLAAGYTLTASSTAGIKVTGNSSLPTPTVTNATTNLAGTATTPAFITNEVVRGECSGTYLITSTSDCIAPEDCDKLELYTFPAPLPFEGKAWSEYTVSTQDIATCSDSVASPCKACCVAGVAFETAVFTSDYRESTYGWFNWQPQDVLPVEIQVSIQHMDYTGNLCDETSSYMTVLRETSLEKGTSGALVQEYERASLGYQNLYWNPNPFVNDAFGFQPVAKMDTLYDSYFLTIKKDHRSYNSYILADQNQITYAFYVPTGSGASLENLINGLVLSTGNPKLEAVKL